MAFASAKAHGSAGDRATHGKAMRKTLDDMGYVDIPTNSLDVIGGLALGLSVFGGNGLLMRWFGCWTNIINRETIP